MKTSSILRLLLVWSALIMLRHSDMTAQEMPQAIFNLATYNIRNANSSDSLQGNIWSNRCNAITDIVRFHEFDIFGTQEGLRHQLERMKEQLPGYEYIGVGRDDGKTDGEHSAIFYNTNKFDLIDSGNFWLSQTPDRPSKGWDAACIRICTWGKFRHKMSGKEFLYFNLHADHVGKQARIESVKLIERKISEFGENLPTFLSGDFNVDQNNECYAKLLSDGIFTDAHNAAEFVYEPNGTFNDWKPNGFTKSRIDHIFITNGIKVKKYGILTDTYRTLSNKEDELKVADGYEADVFPAECRMPSDHFPVLTTVQLP